MSVAAYAYQSAGHSNVTMRISLARLHFAPLLTQVFAESSSGSRPRIALPVVIELLLTHLPCKDFHPQSQNASNGSCVSQVKTARQ
jgi:hypothetical protein